MWKKYSAQEAGRNNDEQTGEGKGSKARKTYGRRKTANEVSQVENFVKSFRVSSLTNKTQSQAFATCTESALEVDLGFRKKNCGEFDFRVSRRAGIRQIVHPTRKL